jgi:hypothetical protein
MILEEEAGIDIGCAGDEGPGEPVVPLLHPRQHLRRPASIGVSLSDPNGRSAPGPQAGWRAPAEPDGDVQAPPQVTQAGIRSVHLLAQ